MPKYLELCLKNLLTFVPRCGIIGAALAFATRKKPRHGLARTGLVVSVI